MHKLLKTSLLSVSLLLMQGCATHANFVQKYNSWVGHNISYLVSQIGYPDSTYILPNKNKVYVYEKSRIYSIPSMPMFGYDNEVIQETCKLFIETNKKGTIVRWGSRGNHCVSK